LLIAARATSDQLESSVHLLWLTQETSEKNTPNVLLQRLLRKLQQMHTRFKLSAGSLRRDRQDPVEIFVIVVLSGAYQARNASQSPPFELFCDATMQGRKATSNTNRKNRRHID